MTPTGPILGIETSCDDTACAVVSADGRVLSSVVSSQLVHRVHGGVVPELASREHLRNWPAVSSQAMEEAGIEIGDLGAIAATRGPGLVGSLLVGLSLGKAIAYGRGLPFFAVHHLEGHLFSPFLGTDGDAAIAPPSKMIGLIVSGGHTTLVAVEDSLVHALGDTRDDAMGEAFDKVGKTLGLPFPGGPLVDAWAQHAEDLGIEPAPDLGVARCPGTLDFSYSGLKTQMQTEIARLRSHGVPVELVTGPQPDTEGPPPRLLGLIASFRRAAVTQLIDRLERLHAEDPGLRDHGGCLAVSGGVAANRLLRREVTAWADHRGVTLRLVPRVFSGDNAAMIAYAALLRWRRGDSDDPRFAEAVSRLPFVARDPDASAASGQPYCRSPMIR